jgi:FkbM family methyltransferase
LTLRDPRIILDIGCNDGTHTRLFFELFKHVRVYSFEPDRRAQQRFITATKDYPKAHLIPLAVGAENNAVDFYPSEGGPPGQNWPLGWDMSGSIRQPKGHLQAHPWCKFGQKTKVMMTRLDDWSRQVRLDNTHIDFIWADVQGAEVDLITGGLETLAKTRYFFTEYSTKELYTGQVDLERILEMLPNFEIVTLWREDVLLRNKDLTREA